MSLSSRTSYLDPAGRPASPIPAAPISLPTTGFVATGPQTYAPIGKRRRMHPLWVAVLALISALALAVPVVLLAADHNDVYVLPHTPSAAEAKAACKTAIEKEAQGRLENAQRDAGDAAVPSVAGVDIDEPVRTATGYTVNGTIRFAVLSFLGSLPASVFVTCTATIDGSKLITSVANR